VKELLLIVSSLFRPLFGGIVQVLSGGFGVKAAVYGWLAIGVQVTVTCGHAGGGVLGGILLFASLAVTQAASALSAFMCVTGRAFEPGKSKDASGSNVRMEMAAAALFVSLLLGGILVGLVSLLVPVTKFWMLMVATVVIALLNSQIVFKNLRAKGL
jgi:hypothetical protein